MLADDAGDDHDEGAGGPANLEARSAEGRDEEAGDDGAVDSSLRGEAGGDGKRHGERQGHQADGDPGHQILGEQPRTVPVREYGNRTGPPPGPARHGAAMFGVAAANPGLVWWLRFGQGARIQNVEV